MKTQIWNGEKISTPGIYANVPLDVYHSQDICDGPSVSSSGLRRVMYENGGSPAHFYAEWSGNPNRIDPLEKKAWTFGRAVHHLMLGQADFAREFVFRPEEIPDKAGVLQSWQGNKMICRQWLAQAAAGGARWDAVHLTWVRDEKQGPLTVLIGEDALHITGIAKALMQHSYIYNKDQPGQGVLNGAIERSFFWKDKRTGLWLKARPDSVPTDSGDYADLKTTISVQLPEIAKAVTNFAYHQQAALIGEGSRVCADIPMTMFLLVFVEKKPPYCVGFNVIPDAHIREGEKQNRDALDIIAGCIKSGKWPGPHEGEILTVGLSDRYLQEAERNRVARQAERAA